MNEHPSEHMTPSHDQIFRDFFQAELPTPWPKMEFPQPIEPRRTPETRELHRHPVLSPNTAGRWTLMVSGAVLLGFGLTLARGPHSDTAERPVAARETPHSLFERATADGSKLQPPVKKTETKTP